MTQHDIRVAPCASHEAMQQSAVFAPAVIEVAQRMAAGRLPLLYEEKLLRFGLHALAVARETSICPAFLALLRRPAVELEWLFGEDREPVAQLLLGLFDGNDAAVSEVVADPDVDDDVRGALMLALAKLAWEGRTSREGVLALLDRFDEEPLARVDSIAWIGWQEAILLLGATDRIERVQRGWQAGRLEYSFREIDQQDWVEQVRAAAEHPDDPQRFLSQNLVAPDDATNLGWSADAPRGPDDALGDDELAWLDVALLRTIPENRTLEEADGLLTALAAGPVRVTPGDCVTEILRASGENAGFDSAEHKAVVVELLTRYHASLERDLAEDKAGPAWIYDRIGEPRGELWARGYIQGIGLHKQAWEPLRSDQRLAAVLLLPLLGLLPDPEGEFGIELSYERRSQLIAALPEIARATKAYWTGEWHPLLAVPVTRGPKVGRNDRCPCGSGNKFKRCCGADA